MKKTITIKWLKKHKACKDGIKIFHELFGESAKITKTNLLKVKHLDLEWFVEELFDEGEKAVELYKEWIKIDGDITDAYCEIFDTVCHVKNPGINPEGRERISKVIWEECDTERALALWEIYKRGRKQKK